MAMTGGTARLVASGTPNSNWPGPVNVYVYYKIAYQDIANNFTTLSLGMYVSTPSGWDIGPWGDFTHSYIGTGTAGEYCVSFNGYIPNFYGTRWLVENVQVNVPHNSDGTKTATIFYRWGAASTWAGLPNPLVGSFSVPLTTIPRAASIVSAPDFNDLSTPTITYSNPAGNSVSSLQACISLTGDKDDIPYRDISKTGTSYTFNLTEEERNTLRNAFPTKNNGTVRFFIRTKIGNETYLSDLTKNFSIIANNPLFSAFAYDVNPTTRALTISNDYLIKYHSNLYVKSGAQALKGATLTSQQITCGNKYTTKGEDTINVVESNVVQFRATDSRGNTSQLTITKNIIDYIRLTCNIGHSTPTAEGNYTFEVSGNYFNGSFGNVNNTLQVYYRYKTGSGDYTDWLVLQPTISDGYYWASVDFTGLDYRTTYTFQAYAVDKLETVYTVEKPIKTMPIFDWSADDFNINVNFNLNNHTVLKQNRDTNETVLSAEGAAIYLRPNGADSQEGQSYIAKDGTFYANGKAIGVNKVLWSGALNLSSGETANLSETVSQQASGIVLVFGRYIAGRPEYGNYNSFFIPKQVVQNHGGASHAFNMNTADFSVLTTKYVYVGDSQIVGTSNNSSKGQSTSGLYFDNTAYALEYVIGV